MVAGAAAAAAQVSGLSMGCCVVGYEASTWGFLVLVRCLVVEEGDAGGGKGVEAGGRAAREGKREGGGGVWSSESALAGRRRGDDTQPWRSRGRVWETTGGWR